MMYYVCLAIDEGGAVAQWVPHLNTMMEAVAVEPITYLDTGGGAVGRAMDLRSTGRGFKSCSGQKLRNNLGQIMKRQNQNRPSPSPGRRS